jgi:ubiquinone/menaquinone biosynthesis C-methylase UbiE
LTPWYDLLLRWFMRERKFKSRLLSQARISECDRILDIGCGTGTLAIMVKEIHPNAEVAGLDPDAKVLGIARAKGANTGTESILIQGMSCEIPCSNNSFDRVLSSLMLHHLSTTNKDRTFKEAFRVLRPRGELHIVDFGPPRSLYCRLVAPLLGTSKEMSANIKGLLPELLRSAGFVGVRETGQMTTIAGALSFYSAQKAITKRVGLES